MVLTPGPNMIYVVSRSITQGTRAGLISVSGVALGFVVYMLCAAFGSRLSFSLCHMPMTRFVSPVRVIFCILLGKPCGPAALRLSK